MLPRGPNIRVPPFFFFGGFFTGLLLEAMVVRLRFVGGASAGTVGTVGTVSTAGTTRKGQPP